MIRAFCTSKSASLNFVRGGSGKVQTDGDQAENIKSENHRHDPMNEMQKKRYGAYNASLFVGIMTIDIC